MEVLSGVRGVRQLRAGILRMAYLLGAEPETVGVLLLARSRISEERLAGELRHVRQVMRPAVARRLQVLLVEEEEPVRELAGLGSDFQVWLQERIRRGSGRTSRRPSVSPSLYSVLKILVHRWLLHEGPVTTSWLVRVSGLSYPPVAAALHRLAHEIVRHSDRRVELLDFPRKSWLQLLAVADVVRATRRFADQSGKPRSPDALVRRLERLDRPDIAVAGVLGARRYHPELDLVGTPRLDLSVHSPGGELDWDFIERLDPALERTEDPSAPAALVVHLVTRADPFFVGQEAAHCWADPVECLLDLQESRLESQAQSFVQALRARSGEWS